MFSFFKRLNVLPLKVPCQESVYSRNVFFTLILPLKNRFLRFKIQKKTLKKVENFGALARISSLKEMAVAGLKIDFWKFWLVQKFGLDEDSHVSKNISKIPTIRGQNRILRGSIPPSLPHCNASFPYSRVYRPMPRAVCPSRAYLHQEAARGTANCAGQRTIRAGVWERSVTTCETGRDTSAQITIWTP